MHHPINTPKKQIIIYKYFTKYGKSRHNIQKFTIEIVNNHDKNDRPKSRKNC